MFYHMLSLNFSVSHSFSLLSAPFASLSSIRFNVPPKLVIDSSARLPAGLLTGSLTDLGDYDQCRKIRVGDGPQFQGQYCLAKIRPALPPPKPDLLIRDVILSMDKMPSLRNTVFEDVARNAHGFYSLPVQLAVCIPSVCSANDISLILQKFLDPLFMSVEVGPLCDVDSSGQTSFFQQLNHYQLFALISVFLFVFLVTISSLTEMCLPKVEHNGSRDLVKTSPFFGLLLSFSVFKSSRKLFSKDRESDTKLHFVHGMRVITMIWIIVCHTYTYGTQFLTEIGCESSKKTALFLESKSFICSGVSRMQT